MPINQQDFDQMMNQARVKLVGSSDAGLKGELFDVLSEFFNDSSCWAQTVLVSATPTATMYPLQVSEGQIIRLAGVVNYGATAPTPSAPANYPLPSVPALMPEIGTLLIKNAPVTNQYFGATVVTNVALPTDRKAVPLIPAWVLPVWHVGILDGLLGKMMAQPSKSYSNDKQSQYHLRRFRDAIARARVSALRANTLGAQAWRFPQQFRSVSQQGGVPAVGSASERSF